MSWRDGELLPQEKRGDGTTFRARQRRRRREKMITKVKRNERRLERITCAGRFERLQIVSSVRTGREEGVGDAQAHIQSSRWIRYLVQYLPYGFQDGTSTCLLVAAMWLLILHVVTHIAYLAFLFAQQSNGFYPGYDTCTQSASAYQASTDGPRLKPELKHPDLHYKCLNHSSARAKAF